MTEEELQKEILRLKAIVTQKNKTIHALGKAVDTLMERVEELKEELGL